MTQVEAAPNPAATPSLAARVTDPSLRPGSAVFRPGQGWRVAEERHAEGSAEDGAAVVPVTADVAPDAAAVEPTSKVVTPAEVATPTPGSTEDGADDHASFLGRMNDAVERGAGIDTSFRWSSADTEAPNAAAVVPEPAATPAKPVEAAVPATTEADDVPPTGEIDLDAAFAAARDTGDFRAYEALVRQRVPALEPEPAPAAEAANTEAVVPTSPTWLRSRLTQVRGWAGRVREGGGHVRKAVQELRSTPRGQLDQALTNLVNGVWQLPGVQRARARVASEGSQLLTAYDQMIDGIEPTGERVQSEVAAEVQRRKDQAVAEANRAGNDIAWAWDRITSHVQALGESYTAAYAEARARVLGSLAVLGGQAPAPGQNSESSSTQQ